jgi:hypothetical protein
MGGPGHDLKVPFIMSNLGLNSLLDEQNNGRLSKIYSVYNGSLKINDYKTYSSAIVGAQCLKITYVYTGATVTGQYAEIDTWTQVMEDSVIDTTGFINATSVSFDGVSDYLTGGDIHNFDHSDAFSISMYVKPSNISDNRVLFSKNTEDANVYGFNLRQAVTTGQLVTQFRSPGGTHSHTFDTTLVADTWQHIVFTYNGGNNISGAKVYRNAIAAVTLPSSGVVSGSWLYNQPFLIGARDSSLYFTGNIDEITVWDKELSDAEVTELYNGGTVINATTHSAAANLVSYYRCGEGDSYPVIFDTKNTDNLTMINMTSDNFEEDVPS